MGHLLKWVTLARILALGDFQICKSRVLSEDQLHETVQRTKQDVVVAERNWKNFRRKLSLLKVAKCVLPFWDFVYV